MKTAIQKIIFNYLVSLLLFIGSNYVFAQAGSIPNNQKAEIDGPLMKVIPSKVKASNSHIQSPAKHIIDGNLINNWGPRTKYGLRNPKAGLGESVTFKFDEDVEIRKFKIWAGSGTSKTRFLRNNRPTKIELSSDNGQSIILQLKDIFGFQEFDVNLSGRKIAMTVLEKKLGEGDGSDLYTFPIAEVELYAIDELLGDLISYLKDGNEKKAKNTLVDIKKERDYKIETLRIDGYPILEFSIRSGLPDVTLALLNEYYVPIETANIKLLSRKNTNQEFADFAQKMSDIRNQFYSEVKKINEDSNPTLEQLLASEKKLEMEYLYLWDNEKKILLEAIGNKLDLALEKRMSNELNILGSIGSDLESIEDIDLFYDGFIKRYEKYLGYSSVKKSISLIYSKKAEMVRANKDQIVELLDNAKSVSEINDIKKKYLTDIEIKTPTISKLLELAQINKDLIINAAEIQKQQKKIAEMERIERERELAEQRELEKLQALMNVTTKTGEPTEEQMKWAVNYQFQAKLQKQESMTKVEAKDAMSALVKLMGMATSGVNYSIRSFEKYSCEKANGKPGYNCDYVMDLNISGGFAGNMYGPLLNKMGSSEIRSARFTRVDGVWMIVEYLD